MRKQAVNPYLPNYEYVPDGEPHVFGKRVYVYGSHDRFGGYDFCMNNYVCWSAPTDDLANWKYEGVIYRKEQDPMGGDAERRLFAPDVQRGPDGRYYMFYTLDHTGIIRVSVCDTPAGKYEFYGGVHYADGTALGRRKDDIIQYDPGVLADSDGRIYLYSGFCPNVEKLPKFTGLRQNTAGAVVVELEADMLTIKKDPVCVVPCEKSAAGTSFEGHAFFEASSIRKIGGRYYFIYSSENGHELCYAVSTAPEGPFVYGGTIISNGDIFFDGQTEALNYTGTNHGSIEQINGKWYVFYHRQTNGMPYSRQGCAEEIQILSDGSIPQVRMTSCGMNGGPLRGMGEYSAAIACCLLGPAGAKEYLPKRRVGREHPYFTQDGGDREENPGQYIANLRDGATVGVRYFENSGAKRISVRARGAGRGTIKVSVERGEPPIAGIEVLLSKETREFSAPITLPGGRFSLWFCYSTEEKESYMDFMSFILS